MGFIVEDIGKVHLEIVSTATINSLNLTVIMQNQTIQNLTDTLNKICTNKLK